MITEMIDVKAFHLKGSHPAPPRLTGVSIERANIRAKWMKEEIQEFLDAGNMADQVDALIDLMYFAFGTLVEMGVKPGILYSCWNVVHEANMKKFDAGVLKDDDGKVRKQKGWEHPTEQISKLLGHQE
jgi:predicted HAD superfamily Cof-like phosphohydrolase